MDKDDLIRRQKELTRMLGARPEGSSKPRGMSPKHRRKLNEELRDINSRLRAFPDYQKKLLKPLAAKKRKKKKATTKPPQLPAGSYQERYEGARELVERHCELQEKLETVRDRVRRQSLKEELASTEALIQRYEPYLKGYKLIRKKNRAKGSGQWIHVWQGGTPQ